MSSPRLWSIAAVVMLAVASLTVGYLLGVPRGEAKGLVAASRAAATRYDSKIDAVRKYSYAKGYLAAHRSARLYLDDAWEEGAEYGSAHPITRQKSRATGIMPALPFRHIAEANKWTTDNEYESDESVVFYKQQVTKYAPE